MKNKDWTDDFVEPKEVNTNKTAGESDSFKALFGVPDSYANKEKNNKPQEKNKPQETEEDILDKMFGSNNTTNENNANQEEESDSMEDNVTQEQEEQKNTKKKGISNLKIRVISGALVVALLSGAGFALYKTEPNRKVKKMNTSEITLSNNEENIKTLTKIEGCLRISKIMKDYQDKNSYITNLDMGTAEVIDGKIAELSDEEYKTILELMYKLENASKKEKQTDEYKQMIKQFVGYSSKVNAYISYYAPQSLNNIIIDEMKDDVEKVLNVSSDKVEVNYNHSSNTINVERTDGGVGEASYSLKSTGKVIDDLTKVLNNNANNIQEIESFIADGTKTVLTLEESTITKDNNGSLLVPYSKEINNKIKDALEQVKLEIYRILVQTNDGKVKYYYLVQKDSIEQSQQQDSSQEQASGYTTGYTRKRTM